MDEQDRVAAFLAAHELSTPPAYRVLDLASELGEVAKEINESTGYGTDPEAVAVAEDELGDALFALLALCEAVDVDADAALDTALAKYEDRLDDAETPGSGE
ncbi:MazG-like family protein [Haloarcula litorea]|uniref:MazG-like family protein n=1 Tax=Haloarcula litorea TaxID=3032579 RepID=UPI0023E7F365|nr:MazG-like family protein [Halomicroarcula sp. GDY20]